MSLPTDTEITRVGSCAVCGIPARFWKGPESTLTIENGVRVTRYATVITHAFMRGDHEFQS